MTNRSPFRSQLQRKYVYYLEGLRASGDTNMMNAASYIEKDFDIGEKESKYILSWWLHNQYGNVDKQQHELPLDDLSSTDIKQKTNFVDG